uniref:Uncharacterized protein n=1 Tax=Arundo donax TaxID=35708 RepID=A0A0A9DKB6_ARUDO
MGLGWFHSGPAHAGRERVLPEVVGEGGPAHVGVAQGLGHEPLVRLHRLEPVPRVPPRADDELGEVAAVRHHEHVRPQTHQEVQRRQARHVPPERRELRLRHQVGEHVPKGSHPVFATIHLL